MYSLNKDYSLVDPDYFISKYLWKHLLSSGLHHLYFTLLPVKLSSIHMPRKFITTTVFRVIDLQSKYDHEPLVQLYYCPGILKLHIKLVYSHFCLTLNLQPFLLSTLFSWITKALVMLSHHFCVLDKHLLYASFPVLI